METEKLAQGSWVVIDEVQKAPALLDEVHRLIETHGDGIHVMPTTDFLKRLWGGETMPA